MGPTRQPHNSLSSSLFLPHTRTQHRRRSTLTQHRRWSKLDFCARFLCHVAHCFDSSGAKLLHYQRCIDTPPIESSVRDVRGRGRWCGARRWRKGPLEAWSGTRHQREGPPGGGATAGEEGIREGDTTIGSGERLRHNDVRWDPVEKREGSGGRETDTCGGEVGSGVGEASLAAGRMGSGGGKASLAEGRAARGGSRSSRLPSRSGGE
jgi:hypothetical protein